MPIPLFAAIPGSGKIRQLDSRADADDYDGSVGITPFFTSNPIRLAGNGGYERIRRFAQSGVAGTDEQLSVTLIRDGAQESQSVTRDFGPNGSLTIPLAGGATQIQVQVGLVGKQGTELGGADVMIIPRRTVRSGSGA